MPSYCQTCAVGDTRHRLLRDGGCSNPKCVTELTNSCLFRCVGYTFLGSDLFRIHYSLGFALFASSGTPSGRPAGGVLGQGAYAQKIQHSGRISWIQPSAFGGGGQEGQERHQISILRERPDVMCLSSCVEVLLGASYSLADTVFIAGFLHLAP